MIKRYHRVKDGKCPCDQDTKIDIIFRNKEKDYNCVAGDYIWEDRGEDYDIVMWRESE